MLSKSNKINLRFPQTKEVFTSGLFFKTKNLQINLDFLGELNQFSVIIPKKNIPLAVNRNKWKRFIYQLIEKDLLNFKPNNLRLIVKVNSRSKLSDEIKKKIEDEFLKIKEFVNKNAKTS